MRRFTKAFLTHFSYSNKDRPLSVLEIGENSHYVYGLICTNKDAQEVLW